MHKDGFPRKQQHSEHGHEGKFAYLLLVVALEDVTEWKRWSVGQLPKSLCHGMPSRWVDCLQHVSACPNPSWKDSECCDVPFQRNDLPSDGRCVLSWPPTNANMKIYK